MWWWIKIHIIEGWADMVRWFNNRKKLLEEIKLQEKYIKALEDELRRYLEAPESRVIAFKSGKNRRVITRRNRYE
ncbi:Uncharacterised protein [Sebaldella termitidis]|uniref:Uncharacterized protein n=1 Tax=Sebaldella termitidis (strain ATCC 33386 / NCTC 11300) TaxID=526218 RepID=D1AGN1_SEBTE|nr:hypothetical protein [Sebaldella termitidis]ACZ10751.1 hypothetical protein Sterm_3918 [Sebaldella termitidis ATCC 33386]SUI26094.1 Uncharacterised protein [Sebaldella termitidis]